MALNVGDAILTFTGDTTQLDQAFNKIATEAGAKMGIATTSIDGMNKSMAVGQQGAVELGDATNLAGEKTKESMYQARGEMGLIVDIFHLHLPRHVRSFIAELPGVGAAMSAAFQATAVLFVISALVEGIKKVAEWAEYGEKMREAWEKASLQLENLTIKEGDHTKSLELANLKLDDQIAKLEKRPDRNKLREALLETSIAADSLAAAFSKDFAKMTEEIGSATSFVGQLSQSLYEIARSGGISGNILSSLPAAIGGAAVGVQGVKKALEEVHEQLLLIDKLRVDQANAKTEQQQIEAAHTLAAAYGVLAQKTNDALTITQVNAPQNIKLITELSSVVVQASAAQKDFGIESETIHKRVTVAVLESAKAELEAWQEKHKALEKYMAVQATYAKEQEKQHAKTIKDSEHEKEELNSANTAVANNQLTQFHRMEQGAIALIDGEIRMRELATHRQEQLLTHQYDLGIISGKKYLEELRLLYKKEADELIAFLNQKQQIIILEAQKEAAARGKIITDAEIKELKAFQDLENKKAQILIQADTRMEKEEDKVQKNTVKRFAQMGKLLKAYGEELAKSGQQTAAWGAAVGTAISAVMQAYATGASTISQALEQMVAAELQALAQLAEKKGTEQLARAFGAYPNIPEMEQHFTAAALWFALGGALSLGAALSSGGSKSGSGAGGGDHPQVDANNPNNQPGQNPVPGGRNVPHLEYGGLITAPTLAMIGEGRSSEAVIPLNGGAMDAIGEAIVRHMDAAHTANAFNIYTKGVISADVLGKMMKKMSRQAATGRARLVATNSYRVTRRG